MFNLFFICSNLIRFRHLNWWKTKYANMINGTGEGNMIIEKSIRFEDFNINYFPKEFSLIRVLYEYYTSIICNTSRLQFLRHVFILVLCFLLLDAVQFHPHLTRKETLYLFNNDICRWLVGHDYYQVVSTSLLLCFAQSKTIRIKVLRDIETWVTIATSLFLHSWLFNALYHGPL